MKNNEKRPTLRDVAQRAGVSSQTVSRVINNHKRVSEGTRERVLQVIGELGYRPNRAAQMLNTQRSNTIEVLTIDPETSLFKSTLAHMAYAAQSYSYNISCSIFDRGKLSEALNSAESRLLDGVVLISSLFLEDMQQQIIESLNPNVPIVQITSMMNASTPSITYNQAAGVQQITQHLIDLGHTKFAEISGREGMIETKIRHETWLEVAEKNGVSPGPSVTGGFVVQGGYEAAVELIRNQVDFTALICANDRSAMGALHALYEHNIRVPEDVSVVGYDNIEGSDHLVPPLTTVAMEFDQLGMLAVEYLVKLIQKPNTPSYQQILAPKLIIRESTAPPSR